jgi:hypothetical protein
MAVHDRELLARDLVPSVLDRVADAFITSHPPRPEVATVVRDLRHVLAAVAQEAAIADGERDEAERQSLERLEGELAEALGIADNDHG